MFKRTDILARLRAKIERHEPVIGGGAGIGLSAKFAEVGGIDLLIVYNSGRFRMAGLGSLAGMLSFCDANALVVEMAAEIITAAPKTPVLAGVHGVDPRYPPHIFIPRLKALGYCGVQNYPTVGLIDGNFRLDLEKTGLGYDKEVDWIAAAHEAGMFTSPYAFNAGEAKRMARAGADVIVAHLGLTTGGSIGAEARVTLDEAVAQVRAIAEAAREEREDVIVLCHGGVISMPDDVQYVLDRLPIVAGFYGASSIERLPCEVALTEQVKKFVGIRRKLKA